MPRSTRSLRPLLCSSVGRETGGGGARGREESWFSSRHTMTNAAMSASRRETAWFVATPYMAYITGIARKLGFTRFRVYARPIHFARERERASMHARKRWIYSRSISRDFLPVNLRPLSTSSPGRRWRRRRYRNTLSWLPRRGGNLHAPRGAHAAPVIGEK